MGVRFWVIGVLLLLSTVVRGQTDSVAPVQEQKASIYNGTQVKLDIASPIIVPATNHWGVQHFEMAVNVRLAQRFYPTFELGFAGGTAVMDTILYESTDNGTYKWGKDYSGYGGFFRVGCDISPFKKHPESPHALLIGVRLGTAVQDCTQGYNLNTPNGSALCHTVKADCWGEIVAGCQVEIWKGERLKVKGERKEPMAFYMGWMGRLKCLFTRYEKEMSDNVTAMEIPWYIPGYGQRDNIGWGVNYYLGWKF